MKSLALVTLLTLASGANAVIYDPTTNTVNVTTSNIGTATETTTSPQAYIVSSTATDVELSSSTALYYGTPVSSSSNVYGPPPTTLPPYNGGPSSSTVDATPPISYGPPPTSTTLPPYNGGQSTSYYVPAESSTTPVYSVPLTSSNSSGPPPTSTTLPPYNGGPSSST
ncbi:hypothetical protein HDU76_011151, partial [Blyttiomyces sp. JEL0837]